MIKAFVDVALPEEAAGVAYRAVKDELITPFEAFVGKGRLREHDWSLRGRVETDGRVIEETIEIVGSDKCATLVKGPGITPTREQTQDVLDELGDKRDPATLSKLVTGSPNGYMRGHWLVKGNLERYANPGLGKLLNMTLPDYAASGGVEVVYPDGGREKDGFFYVLPQDADVRVEWNGTTVRAAERLTKGSVVYAKITHRKDVEDLVERALAKNKEIVFMSKYTVRPELDGEKKAIYNDLREKHGLERRDGNQGDIVDAAFASLLARPRKEPVVALAPDPSYGPKIAAVVDAVYKHGAVRASQDFSVCRFSAGRSEYGGLNKVAREKGKFTLFIGSEIFDFPIFAGDMFEEMHYDVADGEKYVEQVFDGADAKGYDTVVFAFDENDPYEKPVVDAARRRARVLNKAEGADFMFMTPANAAVTMFTRPPLKKVVYAYDNLWGDIVSDAMDLGTSIASVNSVILLADGRVWPEMGGAGTGPAFVDLFEREGFWRYNPMPVIEGMAIGMAQAARFEPENKPLAKYAKALHDACIAVAANGVATPDMAVKLKTPSKKAVDMMSFIKAVRVELARLLGDEKQAAEQEKILKETMKEIL